MLSRWFSDAEIADAKEKFEKCVELFIKNGADLGGDSLSMMLKEAGLPDTVPSLVKDLYVEEVSTASKSLMHPLGDALFGADSKSVKEASEKLTEIRERPVFDPPYSLSTRFIKPSYEDRLHVKELKTPHEDYLNADQRAALREVDRLSRVEKGEPDALREGARGRIP